MTSLHGNFYGGKKYKENFKMLDRKSEIDLTYDLSFKNVSLRPSSHDRLCTIKKIFDNLSIFSHIFLLAKVFNMQGTFSFLKILGRQ